MPFTGLLRYEAAGTRASVNRFRLPLRTVTKFFPALSDALVQHVERLGIGLGDQLGKLAGVG